jgi:hypothetical protein
LPTTRIRHAGRQLKYQTRPDFPIAGELAQLESLASFPLRETSQVLEIQLAGPGAKPADEPKGRQVFVALCLLFHQGERLQWELFVVMPVG